MIRRILTPLDPSPFTETAITLATTIAKQLDAEITGLVVLDIPGISKSIGPLPPGGIYYGEQLEHKKMEEAETLIGQLLRKFKRSCKKAGVSYRVANLQGSPSQRILQESIYYDAIVMGMRTFFHFETGNKAGDSLKKLLDHSVTPIYAVPEKFNIPNIPDEKFKVLLAFDGSLPAARAMQRFAQLASPGIMQVNILTSGDEENDAEYMLNEAEAYLTAHSFNNINKIWTSKHIIKAIDEDYIDAMDLIVVGANSKGGLLDFFLGSLTEHLIDVAKKPLLIGQ